MSATLPKDVAQDIWAKDRQHFVHPWTHFDSFKEEGSLVMHQAEGVYTVDAEGNRYLDGVGGLWCVNIGYGREEMAEVVAEQTLKLAYANPFVDVTNAPAAKLAAKLAELAPGSLNHVSFAGGGSTANETAFRLIQYYWGCKGEKNRKHFLSRKGSYHGSTYITQSLTGKPADRQPEFEYATDFIHHVAEPNVYRRPRDMDEEAFTDFLIADFKGKLEELGANNVAAFFAEPILGAGGVVVPPQRYVEAVHKLCKSHGIVFVSDEVVTGFGRLGAWFASKDVFNIQPDIITCAKGLTSGYQPLGATIFSDQIYDVISAKGHDRWFTNGYTYSGHPVACASALKNIEIMERENLLDHVKNDVGPYFMQKLNELRDMPTVGDVRGKHLMACVVNVGNKETRETLPDEVNIGKRISNAAEKRGLLVRPVGNLNVLSPPLTITRTQIDELVTILRDSMSEVVEDLKKQGISIN